VRSRSDFQRYASNRSTNFVVQPARSGNGAIPPAGVKADVRAETHDHIRAWFGDEEILSELL